MQTHHSQIYRAIAHCRRFTGGYSLMRHYRTARKPGVWEENKTSTRLIWGHCTHTPPFPPCPDKEQ